MLYRQSFSPCHRYYYHFELASRPTPHYSLRDYRRIYVAASIARSWPARQQ